MIIIERKLVPEKLLECNGSKRLRAPSAYCCFSKLKLKIITDLPIKRVKQDSGRSIKETCC